MSKKQIQEIIKTELPHLKKVIKDLENQGLCAGALPDIYKSLNEATGGYTKEIKCYVCDSIFGIESKYRKVPKSKIMRGLHCPYCGSFLIDRVLKSRRKVKD